MISGFLARILWGTLGVVVLMAGAAAETSTVSQAGALDPVPQQAFTDRGTSGAGGDESVDEALSLLHAFPSSESEPASPSETALADSMGAADRPTPFYQRWLDALFDLLAPGVPYSRDKLVFIVGTSVGYDTNVLYSGANKIGSATYGINGQVDYHFGTRRLKVDARLIGGINYYVNRPGGSDDQNYALTLAVDYQWMPRLGVSFNTYSAYLSQPSPQLVGGIFQYSGSYFYTNSSLDLTYQVRPRFSLVLGYAVNGFKYDDETVNQGSGFYQQNFSLSGNWLYSPRTTLILQYRFNPVTYYESDVGSTGQFLLAGFKQTLSPRLNYSLMFGAEYRSLENPAPGSPSSYLGPFVEGTLNYSLAPNSVITGGLRYGTEPSGNSGVTIRQTFRANLGVSRQLGSRLSLGAGVSVEHDNYDQPGLISDFSQIVYNASVSLRYQFALYTSVVVRDDYIVLHSTAPGNSYTRNYISLGLDVTF